MKKIAKILVVFSVLTVMGTLTGCNSDKKAEKENVTIGSFDKDKIKSQRKVQIDGKEVDEITLDDGSTFYGTGVGDLESEETGK